MRAMTVGVREGEEGGGGCGLWRLVWLGCINESMPAASCTCVLEPARDVDPRTPAGRPMRTCTAALVIASSRQPRAANLSAWPQPAGRPHAPSEFQLVAPSPNAQNGGSSPSSSARYVASGTPCDFTVASMCTAGGGGMMIWFITGPKTVMRSALRAGEGRRRVS